MKAPALWLLGLQVTGAAIYNIQDASRPGLSSDDRPLNWWEGGPAYTLASSGAVRINFRGLYTYPQTSVMRDLDKGLGWHKVSCNVSAWALCASDVGQILPWTSPRMPERHEAVTADGWNDLGCSNSAGKVLVSLGLYDISACDVIDEGLDLLYTPGAVYHRHNTLQTWKYWLLVILAIILVRFLSYNIQALWEPQEKTGIKPQLPALACSLGVLVVVLLDGDSLFVTKADQVSRYAGLVFFWATVGYILVYMGIHAVKRNSSVGHETPVYNVIVTSLLLVACRFYSSAETPYNLVLIGILACRGWTKLFETQNQHNPSLILDALYLSVCIELAYDGTRELLVAVLGIAYLGGRLLMPQDEITV